MEDFLDESQLVEFCQQLGLAKDGFLDENELKTVCNYLGFHPSPEMVEDLFEELDSDRDGKVHLNELSQRLLDMGKSNVTEEKNEKPNLTPTCETVDGPDVSFCSEKSLICVLDKDSNGMTDVGTVLDMWVQFGIPEETGLRILKEFGFQTNSRTSSFPIQDLSKSIVNVIDQCSGKFVPPVIHAALLTYRADAQFLRGMCANLEKERQKLKSDIYDAQQRSNMLAQEIDEQNARLEKDSRIDLLRLEEKFNEQVNKLNMKFLSERENIVQQLNLKEKELKTAEENEEKWKNLVSQFKEENDLLEKELANERQEFQDIKKINDGLQKELEQNNKEKSKFEELEYSNFQTLKKMEEKLDAAKTDIKFLRDQNDEFTIQMETLKARADKANKLQRNGFVEDEGVSFANEKSCEGDCKYKYDHNKNLTSYSKSSEEELDTLDDPLEKQILSHLRSSNNDLSMMSLAACMGESSTDSGTSTNSVNSDRKDHSTFDIPTDVEQVKYKTLENEMEEIKKKIVTILSEKDMVLKENQQLKSIEKSSEKTVWKNSATQTDSSYLQSPNTVSNKTDEMLTDGIESKSADERCKTLEKSLELMRFEYERCEDYWQNKLQEEREEYEKDREISDKKFDELLQKIKEYEDLMETEVTNQNQLPPIDERPMLEQQITDLEIELEALNEEFKSIKLDHEQELEKQRKFWETKMADECNQLEQQVQALTSKCHEYEARINTLASSERSTLEEKGMIDMLRDKISEYEHHYKPIASGSESQLLNADSRRAFASKKDFYSSHYANPIGKPAIPERKSKSRNYLEILHQSADQWGRKLPPTVEKTSSLPFFSSELEPSSMKNAWAPPSPLPYRSDIWNPPSSPSFTGGKKAWCHVELGWLQSLRARLKHKEEQCYMLEMTLQTKETQSQRIISDLKADHEHETTNWENLMHATQELIRQQAIKYKDQANKLAHTKSMLKELWMENTKLLTLLRQKDQQQMPPYLSVHANVPLQPYFEPKDSTSKNNNASNSLFVGHVSTRSESFSPPSHHSLPHPRQYFSN